MATALTHSTPIPGTGITARPRLITPLFDERFRVRSVFDRSFRQLAGSNLYETGDEYIVQLALPGVNMEQCDVQLTGQTLVIKGARNLPRPQNAAVVWQGIDSAEFVESMSLPGDVDASYAEARYEHGILTIIVPKAEHTKANSVKVSVAK